MGRSLAIKSRFCFSPKLNNIYLEANSRWAHLRQCDTLKLNPLLHVPVHDLPKSYMAHSRPRRHQVQSKLMTTGNTYRFMTFKGNEHIRIAVGNRPFLNQTGFLRSHHGLNHCSCRSSCQGYTLISVTGIPSLSLHCCEEGELKRTQVPLTALLPEPLG
ncbi:hypothetical protein VNO77_07183 [Canavalia gladiata]|uniref:Uncharacterized protein n=1 Tax=Canavalia gladiata TaxID=3824 RepID=A0AAN9QW13_CANGL